MKANKNEPCVNEQKRSKDSIKRKEANKMICLAERTAALDGWNSTETEKPKYY